VLYLLLRILQLAQLLLVLIACACILGDVTSRRSVLHPVHFEGGVRCGRGAACGDRRVRVEGFFVEFPWRRVRDVLLRRAMRGRRVCIDGTLIVQRRGGGDVGAVLIRMRGLRVALRRLHREVSMC
jgi:hypothetical protein